MSRDQIQADFSKSRKMATRRSLVLGVSWRKFNNTPEDSEENEVGDCPSKVSNIKENEDCNIKRTTLRRTLTRMQSMRDAFGTLRQVRTVN